MKHATTNRLIVKGSRRCRRSRVPVAGPASLPRGRRAIARGARHLHICPALPSDLPDRPGPNARPASWRRYSHRRNGRTRTGAAGPNRPCRPPSLPSPGPLLDDGRLIWRGRWAQVRRCRPPDGPTLSGLARPDSDHQRPAESPRSAQSLPPRQSWLCFAGPRRPCGAAMMRSFRSVQSSPRRWPWLRSYGTSHRVADFVGSFACFRDLLADYVGSFRGLPVVDTARWLCFMTRGSPPTAVGRRFGRFWGFAEKPHSSVRASINLGVEHKIGTPVFLLTAPRLLSAIILKWGFSAKPDSGFVSRISKALLPRSTANTAELGSFRTGADVIYAAGRWQSGRGTPSTHPCL